MKLSLIPKQIASTHPTKNTRHLESGEVDLPFVYEGPEAFWRAVISGGPPQATMDIVGESVLKEAVLEAVTPYMTDTGGVRFDNNAFQYITATSAS
ncbi:hypothetical protein MNBD_ACTINO01-2363 [hydrothermal vent metagenome]|uniref:Uncharacterized protein n=1 Tax=hydrothermal vent metagenome TaxID=652676 RepID=A0A3B0SZQ6_9ZZZZ